MPPDVVGVLEDIRDAANHIADDTSDMTFEAFLKDRRARQLVERNFLIIGEAVNRLRRHAPDTVMRLSNHHEIVAFRNALVHNYDDISYPRVWHIVQEALPILRTEVDTLLLGMNEH